jgi:hypothetical protein
MGFIPPPPPDRMTMRVGETVVDLTQYMPQYGWLCLYCHTVQSAHRDDCRNCGAPKPGIEEAAAWVADQFAARLGIKRP